MDVSFLCTLATFTESEPIPVYHGTPIEKPILVDSLKPYSNNKDDLFSIVIY